MISSLTSTVVFQTVGGAFFVSAGQAGFTNTLLKQVPIYAPNVSPQQVVSTGATELRKVFDEADIPGILRAYMNGLKVSYAIAIAVAGMSVIFTFLVPMKKLDPSKIAGGAA